MRDRTEASLQSPRTRRRRLRRRPRRPSRSGDLNAIMRQYADRRGHVRRSHAGLDHRPQGRRPAGRKASSGMKPGDYHVTDRQVQIVGARCLRELRNREASRLPPVLRGPTVSAQFTDVYQRQKDGSWKIVNEHVVHATDDRSGGRPVSETMEGGCACGRVRYSVAIDERRGVPLPLPDVPACDGIGVDRVQGREGQRRPLAGRARLVRQFADRRAAILPRMRHVARLSLQAGQRRAWTSPSPRFDDPSRFVPEHHFGAESIHRAWLNTEGLPEIRTDETIRSSSTSGRTPPATFLDERSGDPLLDRVRRCAARLSRAGAGTAGHPSPRPVLRRRHELDQVRPRGTDCRGGLPRDHARPARAWTERQAAWTRILSARDSCARPARTGRASGPCRIRSRRFLARSADHGRRRWARG